MKPTLDGFPLDQEDVTGFHLQPGTGAAVRVLRCAKEVADAIEATAKPMGSELVLDATDDGYDKETFQKLTVLGTVPTNLRGLVGVVVVDVRAYLPYVMHKRAYNMRRRTGNLRRVAGGDVVAFDGQALAADVAYAPWSLNPENEPWSGEECLRDVAQTPAAALGLEIEFRASAINALAGQDPDKLDLRDTSDAALARAMAHLGGRVDMGVSKKGALVFYDRADGSEAKLFGLGGSEAGGTRTAADQGTPLNPEIVLTPYALKQDRRRERPSKVVVYVPVIAELRSNYVESEQAAALPDEDTQKAECRMDGYTRTTKDLFLPTAARNAIQGEIIRLIEAIEAYNDTTNNGARPFPGLPDLSLDIVRRRWLSPLLMAYAWQETDTAGIWRARMARLRADYRLAFRFQKWWCDRIRELRPEMLSIEDFEAGGVRAGAAVYADHAIQQAARWFDSKRLADEKAKHLPLRNVYARGSDGPGGIVGTPIGSLDQATAVVGIADQDLCAIRIGFAQDDDGEAAQVFRSAFEDQSLPTHDLTQPAVHLQDASFTEEHEVSVVLAAVPAVPNNKAQLMKLEVGPEDLGDNVLGQAIGEAMGPPLEIMIHDYWARFAWPNTVAGEQAAWASFTEGGDAIRDGYGDPVNLAELEDLARALATEVYIRFQDRVEGSLTTALTSGVELTGNLSGISYDMKGGPDGGALITISSAPEGPRINPYSLLPAGVRRVVERRVDLGP